MKKIMIFAAMAAMFSLASCQKDEVVANNEAKVSPVFTASINAGTTKTTVDVSTGKVTWESTDKITITDASEGFAIYKIKSIDGNTGKATFELESGALGDGPYTATYGSALSTYQTYSATAGKLYMTAPATSNNSFTFTVQCGLMKLNLSKPGETIIDIAVTGTPTGDTKKTYTMYCPGGVDISSGQDFFIALPAGSYDKIEVYKHDATNGFMVCSLSPSTPIAISDNHIKPVNASEGKIAFSESQNLPGVFSISNDGGTTIKQVRFSKGNLVAAIDATGAPTAWKFATNQYDYIGEDGANNTIGSTAGDVDLFGWSTASTTYGINTSTLTDDYSGEFVDWGKAYCASKSISQENTWRTLSNDEWKYLINKNDDKNIRKDKYKYGVTVCSKENCVVLLPDNWQWDVSTVGTNWQTGGYPETATVDNPVTWQKMEAAGAVCLPAAGYREGDNAVGFGDWGYYWSSTAYDESEANSVCFNSDNFEPGGNGERYNGYSVRLITESK